MKRSLMIGLVVVLLPFLTAEANDNASDVNQGSEYMYARIYTAKIPGGLGESLEALQDIARSNGTVEIATFPRAEGPGAEFLGSRTIVRLGERDNRYPGFAVRARSHLTERVSAGLVQMSEDGTHATELDSRIGAQIEWTLPSVDRSPLEAKISLQGEAIALAKIYEISHGNGQRWPAVIRIDGPRRGTSIIQIYEYLDKRPGDSALSPAAYIGEMSNTSSASYRDSDGMNSEKSIGAYDVTDPDDVYFLAASTGLTFDLDSGWEPGGWPIQVRLAAGAGLDLWSSVLGDFSLTRQSSSSGELSVGSAEGDLTGDIGAELAVQGALDTGLFPRTEFDIPYTPNFDLRCNDSASFYNYLLDSSVAISDTISSGSLFSVGLDIYIAAVEASVQAEGSLSGSMTAASILTLGGEMFTYEGESLFVPLENCGYSDIAYYDENLTLTAAFTFYPEFCATALVIFEWCTPPLFTIPWDIWNGPWDLDFSSSSLSFPSFCETLSTPNTPSGSSGGCPDVIMQYSIDGSSCTYEHPVEYRFFWDDGSISDWSSSTSVGHSWSIPGDYTVRVQARCATNTSVMSDWSPRRIVSVGGTVTTPSLPSGPVSGSTDTLHTYSTGGGSCSCGHSVEYRFFWDDGSFSSWSSSTSAEQSWSNLGLYTVRAQARCATHTSVLSEWSPPMAVEISPGGMPFIYVDDDAACPGSGTSIDPYCQIQSAIDNAGHNDTIIVRDGTYTGYGNKNLDFGGKALTLKSENGPADCIIDCENDGRGFVFWQGETSDSVLHGFTITNGDTSYGGAIYSESSSPAIMNCILKNNCAAYGGGICLSTSSATITNCTIADNTADYGAGGIFAYNSSAQITHCTISNNTAVSGGAIFLYTSVAPLTDSILWNNSAAYGRELLLAVNSQLDVEYSDIEGGQAEAYVEADCTLNWGAGNIVQNPRFVGGGDYHLLAFSPCIDAGTDAGVDTDIDGDSRPLFAECDMGSDECTEEYIPELTQINLAAPADGETVVSAPTLTWLPDGGADNIYVVGLYLHPDGSWLYSPTISLETSWTIPSLTWQTTPDSSSVAWMVYGIDTEDPDKTVITSDELWWFHKQQE